MPDSIREVSSTSPTSAESRVVSSAITARNASRWSGPQLAPALLQRPRRADHGRHRAAQLVRDERDEVRAQRGQPAELVRGRALGLVGAQVLDRRRDEPAEERHELDLLGAEGRGLGARDHERPDRPRPELQRREHARSHAELEQARLLGVAPVGDVLPVDGPVLVDHRLEDRAGDRDRGAGAEELLLGDPGGRHHDGAASLDEEDRGTVEGQEAAQLLDEGREGHVEVERGAERAGGAARRLLHVDPPAELVAEPLRFGGALARRRAPGRAPSRRGARRRRRARARSATRSTIESTSAGVPNSDSRHDSTTDEERQRQRRGDTPPRKRKKSAASSTTR